MRAQQLIVG